MKKKSSSKSASKSKAKIKFEAQNPPAPAKSVRKPSKVMKAAKQIRKTTKKMVDDVILKLVGMRVLERAQEVSRGLLQDKRSKAKTSKKIQSKKK